jgi:hypothetical protein
MTVFSGYGDDVTVSLETRILEAFNGDSEYKWKADSSKFITKTEDMTFPILTYVDAWPVAAFGYNRNGDADPIKSLGINGRFDRKGYNWIDLYPVKTDDPDEKPFEIQIPGRVRNFDMWVWGSNLKYYIEIYVRDYQGVVHAIKLGDIAYIGWRNLRVNVPTNISQSKRIIPAYAGLKFVKFRIWTQPVERVENFYIYFKQFKILTDVFETLFDGNDLADPQHVERLWANN